MKRKVIAILLAVVVLSIMTIVLCSCSGGLLDTPENINYNGSTITWDAVEGAEYYLITVGTGTQAKVTATSFPYIGGAEPFTVKIVASTLDDKIQSTEGFKTFTPLPQISAINVTKDGVISWADVEGATGYRIKINGQEQEITSTTFSTLPVGVNTVQVMPFVTGDTSYYSKYSSTKTVTILGAPASVRYNGNTIEWDMVQYALGYEVYVNGTRMDGVSGVTLPYDSHNTNFGVTIKAIGDGDGVCDSVTSEVHNFVYLQTATNLQVNSGVLSWDMVNGATAYKIKIDGEVQETLLTENNYSSFNPGRSYDVQIMPVSTENKYFSSWSAVKSLNILPAPVIQWNGSLEHSGGQMQSIKWDKVSGAAGYTVEVFLNNEPVEEKEPFGGENNYFEYNYAEIGTYTVRVKTNATIGSDNYDSKFCEAFTVVRLAPPTLYNNNAIVSDPYDLSAGFTVSFNTVAFAFEYSIIGNSGEKAKSNTNSIKVTDLDRDSTDITRGDDITYRIRSIAPSYIAGARTAYISSLPADDLTFTVSVLPQPADLDIGGTTLSWGQITNALGYVVSIDGGDPQNAQNNSFDLDRLSAGDYLIKVCSKGNGSTVLPSVYTGAINVIRLKAPTDLHVGTSGNDENMLGWNNANNDGVDGYNVYINGTLYTKAQENGNLNVENLVQTTGTTIDVCTNGKGWNSHETIYYMTSEPSSPLSVTKLAAPTFPEVAFTNSQFVWNAPANIYSHAYSPTYEVLDGSNNDATLAMGLNSTSWDISVLVAGAYSLKVKAIGNGTEFINSTESSLASIRKLETPTVTVKGSNYVWPAVAWASGYSVFVGSEKVFNTDAVQDTYEFTPNFREQTTYSVKVIAVGDGGNNTIDSDAYSFAQTTQQLTVPTFSVRYSSEIVKNDGKIIIDITQGSANANGYRYVVGGKSTTLLRADGGHTHFEADLCEPGAYNIVVHAVGGSFSAADGTKAGESTYYLDCPSDTAIAQQKTLRLLNPVNEIKFVVNTKGFTWVNIEENNGYEYQIAWGGNDYDSTVYFTDTNSFLLDDTMEYTKVKIRVRAKSDGSALEVTSAWTESEEYNIG